MRRVLRWFLESTRASVCVRGASQGTANLPDMTTQWAGDSAQAILAAVLVELLCSFVFGMEHSGRAFGMEIAVVDA